VGTRPRSALFEPRKNFRAIETIFAAEPMSWQPITSDELRYRLHVHRKHLSDLLRREDISFGTLVGCQFFTHRHPYQVTNLIRGHDEYCIHGENIVIDNKIVNLDSTTVLPISDPQFREGR
jgi:hypothetical protein